MSVAAVFVILVLTGASRAGGEEPAVQARPAHTSFRLDLEPLVRPGYGPARELRLAQWDCPMSRLELAVAREQWAARHPGPGGAVIPFQQGLAPFRLDLRSPAQPAILGPWSPQWTQLTWQEKVAAGAQAGLLAWVVVEAGRHALRPHGRRH